jgi:hypothetical protein
MQARFPGKCRDCGNKFPAGTDIDWQKGQGASCCNGSPQADKRTIVDRFGLLDTMQMEWVEEKTTQEVVGFQGDSPVYEERVYSGYNWMCVECRLVWDRQHQAVNCGSRGHVATYEDTYGVREVVNGVPKGHNMYSITRTAIRREESKDTPPVAPRNSGWGHATVPVEYLPYGGTTDGKDSEWVPVNWPQVEEPAPQADPQDMTSEQLWESMGPGTITTSWN